MSGRRAATYASILPKRATPEKWTEHKRRWRVHNDCHNHQHQRQSVPSFGSQSATLTEMTSSSSSLRLSPPLSPRPQPHILARALCNRRTGIGGDGLILVSAGDRTKTADTTDSSITVELWNSDGSKAEISGNGTCCVAAFVVWRSLPGVMDQNGEFIACTGAGRRRVRFVRRSGNEFHFMVDMDVPIVKEICVEIQVQTSVESVEATILNVGNPQCALFHEGSLPQDWRTISRNIAANPCFPDGVNISFSRVLDRNTLVTAFYERGAGETSSSGTGSIGAAVAAILRELADSPVTVRTVSGGLRVFWEGLGSIVELEGHAEIMAEGEFFGLLGITSED